MIMTVENSLERMRQLMLQLREGAAPVGVVAGVDLSAVAGELAAAAASALDVAAAGEGGDGGEQRGVVVRDHGGVEALRVLLGDEAGGQFARAEARVLHDGAEEIDIVAEALDAEIVERLDLQVRRLVAGFVPR